MAKSPAAAAATAKLVAAPASRPGATGARAGALSRWLETHPEALAFLDEWLALRRSGTTLWSLRDVLLELRTAYAMPPIGESGLRGWLERNRLELYR